MSDTGEIERLRKLLDELQSQFAFQEQTIAELSDALARQQDDIAQLQRDWELVQERYASLQEQLRHGATDATEKPPHY